ncbi:leucyl/phenylalanyl-tRNA--protein transferase [bacterium A37T11]|nr:leucyl/phenylalanyl-tRNA--protein transferase [bacterium A37T11]
MVFQLHNEDFWFPDPNLSDKDGLLAIGGDLRADRLKLAYRKGIFPWYSDDTPILWYAPHERFVLFPDELKISKSMRKVIRLGQYRVSVNEAFARVISHCAQVKREGQDGTWITGDMERAYQVLHEQGCATSVEVWAGPNLVGGLYGVEVGNVFCGESMFSLQPNSSKMALIELCTQFSYRLIDCQVYTDHLASLGARMIPAEEYLQILHDATHLLH